jgi:hypothetical protein
MSAGLLSCICCLLRNNELDAALVFSVFEQLDEMPGL